MPYLMDIPLSLKPPALLLFVALLSTMASIHPCLASTLNNDVSISTSLSPLTHTPQSSTYSGELSGINFSLPGSNSDSQADSNSDSQADSNPDSQADASVVLTEPAQFYLSTTPAASQMKWRRILKGMHPKGKGMRRKGMRPKGKGMHAKLPMRKRGMHTKACPKTFTKVCFRRDCRRPPQPNPNEKAFILPNLHMGEWVYCNLTMPFFSCNVGGCSNCMEGGWIDENGACRFCRDCFWHIGGNLCRRIHGCRYVRPSLGDGFCYVDSCIPFKAYDRLGEFPR